MFSVRRSHVYLNSEVHSQMSFKIIFFKNFSNFTEKHVLDSLFNEVAGLQGMSLQHRCFPVRYAKYLKPLIFPEYLRWLLVWIEEINPFCTNVPICFGAFQYLLQKNGKHWNIWSRWKEISNVVVWYQFQILLS